LKTQKKKSLCLKNKQKNKEKAQAKVDRLRARLSAKESERNVEERLNSTKTLDDLKE